MFRGSLPLGRIGVPRNGHRDGARVVVDGTLGEANWLRRGRFPGSAGRRVVASTGLLHGSLLVLSLGTLLIGAYQAFAQFYRFASSEASDDANRPRAISLVLAGGIAAACLDRPSHGWVRRCSKPRTQLVPHRRRDRSRGCWRALWTRVPAPMAEGDADQPRPLLAIMRQPGYAVALFGAATGSGVMVLAMTATPSAMAHHGHSLGDAVLVIQLHTLGMFVRPFFTGSLIDRFGVLRVMVSGALLLSGHAVLSASGSPRSHWRSFCSASAGTFCTSAGPTLLTELLIGR